MTEGVVDACRVIFPVRQQVDGEEIHRRRDFRVLQPEFPDIGVGHRLADLGLHLADQLRQARAGDFLAQQRLVADDHRRDYVRVGLGRGDQRVDFLLRVHRVAIDPGAQHQLEAVLARQGRDFLEAGHRVGAHALEAFGEQREVGVHPLGAQDEGLVEGRLVLVERAVGGALQLVRGRGCVRQQHRLADGIPEAKEGEDG